MNSSLGLLFLAGFIASAALLVSSVLAAFRTAESRPASPGVDMANRLDALAISIADSTAAPNSAASVAVIRGSAADEAWRLCRLRDRATTMFADSALLLRLGPGVLSSSVQATERLERACSLRSQFGQEAGFDALLLARSALEATRAEAQASVETCAARIRSAVATNSPAAPNSGVPLLSWLAGLLATAACGAAIVAYCTAPTPTRRVAAEAPRPANVQAHARDFANEITIIGGFNELLLESLPPNHPSRADHEEIRRAVQRADHSARLLVQDTPVGAGSIGAIGAGTA